MIDQTRLSTIFLDCLYRPEEIPKTGCAPEGAVCVRGIATVWGLHPERLTSHRAAVAGMLGQLPGQFMRSGGGGWSFLNACNTRDGEQWTGLHAAMEQLFVLGIGLGMAEYLMPRELWPALPGEMPYIVVDDARVEHTVTQATAAPAAL